MTQGTAAEPIWDLLIIPRPVLLAESLKGWSPVSMRWAGLVQKCAAIRHSEMVISLVSPLSISTFTVPSSNGGLTLYVRRPFLS